jgi:hypothetical protein
MTEQQPKFNSEAFIDSFIRDLQHADGFGRSDRIFTLAEHAPNISSKLLIKLRTTLYTGDINSKCKNSPNESDKYNWSTAALIIQALLKDRGDYSQDNES